MKPKKLLILFLIVLFTVLQCTALNYINIFKIKPDILLVLIIFFSLNFGKIYGMIVGALCGLFNEATCGVACGQMVFIYSFAGLILGYIGRWVYNQRIANQICIAFVFNLVIYLFLFFLFQLENVNLPLFSALIFTILPASIYTALVTPVLFLFLNTVLNLK